MELRQLVYAEAVARHRHFTRAAEELHVAQSALSHQIRRLEAELGTELFERTSRRVVPTEAGRGGRRPRPRACSPRSRGCARSSTSCAAWSAAGSRSAPCCPAGELEVTTLLARFAHAFPGIEVGLREGTAAEMLALLEADELDVAFCSMLGDAPPDGSRRCG